MFVDKIISCVKKSKLKQNKIKIKMRELFLEIFHTRAWFRRYTEKK